MIPSNRHCQRDELSAAARLRSLLARPDKVLVCPGVYDGFTARIALRAGFECLYMV